LGGSEGDSIGPKGDPEGNRRGAAHSRVQGGGDKSVPGEGTLVFRGGKRKYYKWGYSNEGETEMDRRLDLGLQDAPRSTTYTRSD